MGGKVAAIIASTLIVMTNAIRVNITDVWRPDFGWEVTCTWEMPFSDSLQSVRLSNDGQQFMIYRPEMHGALKSEVFRQPERTMAVRCGVVEPGGQRGRCALLVEPLQPIIRPFTIKCEVSGERPTFRMEEKEYVVKPNVPPSNATLESTLQQEGSQARVSLNCSSMGLPAPNLQWTIGDDKVQADFTGREWNPITKLWQVWSFLSYTRADYPATATCTPVTTVDGATVKGVPAEYNSAARCLSLTTVTMLAAFVLQLLR